MKFCKTFAVDGINEDGDKTTYYLSSMGGIDLWYHEPRAYGNNFDVIPVDAKKIEPFEALGLPRKVLICNEKLEFVYGGN